MQKDLCLQSYHYHLPEENIAQSPADKRDHSKLMIYNRSVNTIEHKVFNNIIDYIKPGDMLVVNNTKVFPARLDGFKESGGKVEVFLLQLPQKDETGDYISTALLKASRKPKVDSQIIINENFKCKVIEQLEGGKVKLALIAHGQYDLYEMLNEAGDVPLPPYIKRDGKTTDSDKERYQTVYAQNPGAVAAPTAGLHFTKELLDTLQQNNVTIGNITLHVGYGTFAPVRSDNIKEHQIHHEYITVPKETVQQIEKTKNNGGKIWAVGTTSVRALEYAAKENDGKLVATAGWCDLYIYPSFSFKVIDNLITNFHLPNSSLMFLVSAFCGRENLLEAYQTAITEKYRFFSYGDAMAIIG